MEERHAGRSCFERWRDILIEKAAGESAAVAIAGVVAAADAGDVDSEAGRPRRPANTVGKGTT